jgi:6-phosphogluconolactonase
MNGEVHQVEDVAVAFAELVAAELRALAEERAAAALVAADDGDEPMAGRVRVAFSGGPTARRCYTALARQSGLPWAQVEAFFGDERCVPPDDADSNYRMVREVLFEPAGPLAAVHPMSCAAGADHYQELVRRAERLDLVHLGLGPDGHTASLFPESEALVSPGERLVAINTDPSGRNAHERMTLTMPVLDGARLAVFTVSGPEKAEAFARVRAGERVPGALVASERVIWLVDAAAAGG